MRENTTDRPKCSPFAGLALSGHPAGQQSYIFIRAIATR
jgi:hypothetical protein